MCRIGKGDSGLGEVVNIEEEDEEKNKRDMREEERSQHSGLHSTFNKY